MSLSTCILALAIAAAGGLTAAARVLPWLGLVAALIALAAIVARSLTVNRPAPAAAGGTADDADQIARAIANAWLMSAAYAWGALVLIGIDRLGTLKWYHYGQYGGIMLIMATVLAAYAHTLGRPQSPLQSPPLLSLARLLAAGQAGAAVVGIGWLALSGKLMSQRGDWAANQVFVIGGLAVAIISALAARRPASGKA